MSQETDARITDLEDRLETLSQQVSAGGDAQCSAANPHTGQMSYSRDKGYSCGCGKIYQKGTGGVLREVD